MHARPHRSCGSEDLYRKIADQIWDPAKLLTSADAAAVASSNRTGVPYSGKARQRRGSLNAVTFKSNKVLNEWCPGTESNRRHRDFQSRALPTELPGLSRQGRPPVQAPRSLPFAFLAVHPGRIGSRPGNTIALIEPAEQVAILAAAGAERGVLRSRRLTASGTGLGITSLAHMPHGWGARHRFARSPRRQSGGKAARSRQDAAQSPG